MEIEYALSKILAICVIGETQYVHFQNYENLKHEHVNHVTIVIQLF